MFLSDKMAKKLTNLCTDVLQNVVFSKYDIATTIKCYEENRHSYENTSLEIGDITAGIQNLLEKEFSGCQLPSDIKVVLEALETKLEKLAFQNIVNEQLVNNQILKCSEPADRELLKRLLMDILAWRENHVVINWSL